MFDILWDFGKLVISKAELKIFVFQQSNGDRVRETMRQLKSAFNDFETKISGERYLLAGYSIKSGTFSLDGTYEYENDFIFGAGSIASANAEFICAAYEYNESERAKKGL